MEIDTLLAQMPMPPEPRAAFDNLLERKRETPELGTGPRLAEIDQWLMSELDRLDPRKLMLSDIPATDMTDAASRLYRQLIGAE